MNELGFWTDGEYGRGGGEWVTAMQGGLMALEQALADDDPIELTDVELARLAELACEELRRRLPRYALEQGDIDDGAGVAMREQLAEATAAFRESMGAPEEVGS